MADWRRRDCEAAPVRGIQLPVKADPTEELAKSASPAPKSLSPKMTALSMIIFF